MQTSIRCRSDLTYEDLVKDIRSQIPQTCPRCGSREIQPLYWVDSEVWDCSACAAIFSERD